MNRVPNVTPTARRSADALCYPRNATERNGIAMGVENRRYRRSRADGSVPAIPTVGRFGFLLLVQREGGAA
jgi:hypothetical protein